MEMSFYGIGLNSFILVGMENMIYCSGFSASQKHIIETDF